MNSNDQFNFEKLRVWQKSKELSKSIYKITSRAKFPPEEKYGLISQMRRSSISVASNIAEGMARTTKNDRSHFITISYGSAVELLNQAIITYELDFLEVIDYQLIRVEVNDICSMLAGLRASISKDPKLN